MNEPLLVMLEILITYSVLWATAVSSAFMKINMQTIRYETRSLKRFHLRTEKTVTVQRTKHKHVCITSIELLLVCHYSTLLMILKPLAFTFIIADKYICGRSAQLSSARAA